MGYRLCKRCNDEYVQADYCPDCYEELTTNFFNFTDLDEYERWELIFNKVFGHEEFSVNKTKEEEEE